MGSMIGEGGASCDCCVVEGRKRSAVVSVQKTLRGVSWILINHSYRVHLQLERR
jgi:hypothetical protein